LATVSVKKRSDVEAGPAHDRRDAGAEHLTGRQRENVAFLGARPGVPDRGAENISLPCELFGVRAERLLDRRRETPVRFDVVVNPHSELDQAGCGGDRERENECGSHDNPPMPVGRGRQKRCALALCKYAATTAAAKKGYARMLTIGTMRTSARVWEGFRGGPQRDRSSIYRGIPL